LLSICIYLESPLISLSRLCCLSSMMIVMIIYTLTLSQSEFVHQTDEVGLVQLHAGGDLEIALTDWCKTKSRFAFEMSQCNRIGGKENANAKFKEACPGLMVQSLNEKGITSCSTLNTKPKPNFLPLIGAFVGVGCQPADTMAKKEAFADITMLCNNDPKLDEMLDELRGNIKEDEVNLQDNIMNLPSKTLNAEAQKKLFEWFCYDSDFAKSLSECGGSEQLHSVSVGGFKDRCKTRFGEGLQPFDCRYVELIKFQRSFDGAFVGSTCEPLSDQVTMDGYIKSLRTKCYEQK